MKKNDDYVTLTAVGDIMLGWGVEERIKSGSGGYPFESVASILQSSDVTFGNLEAPLTTESEKAVWDYTKILDKPVIIDGKAYGSSIYCKADPVAAERLSHAGFNILSLANNHIMDYGEEGLNETLDALTKYNIKTIGAGRDLSDARKPAVFRINGVNVGILAYCDTYIAGRRRAGVAPTKYIEQDIQSLKKDADFIVVSIHQGMDISEYPLKSEIERMHQIIDWGANIILRHHPHVVQGVEEYNGGIILYSLGNFVFDYMIDPLWKDLDKAKRALIFQCRFTKNKVLGYDIVPIGLDKSFQPVILQNSEKRKYDAYLSDISSNLPDVQSNEGGSHLERNYLKINVILAYHVMLSSIKKGQFRNIFLIIDKISISDFKLLVKWMVNRIFLRFSN
ncbi:CapA family protein [Methanosarcina sp. Mfa9]|uniref:CapA family protein n=1 Tax=Methanosarcina sp. Mfa9 TaxID=3439063 RepID=UPI003F85462B